MSGHWSLITDYCLLVTDYCLLFTGHWSLLNAVKDLLITDHCSLVTDYCLLVTDYFTDHSWTEWRIFWLLITVHWSLITDYCSLITDHCLLISDIWSLLTVLPNGHGSPPSGYACPLSLQESLDFIELVDKRLICYSKEGAPWWCVMGSTAKVPAGR